MMRLERGGSSVSTTKSSLTPWPKTAIHFDFALVFSYHSTRPSIDHIVFNSAAIAKDNDDFVKALISDNWFKPLSPTRRRSHVWLVGELRKVWPCIIHSKFGLDSEYV